MQITAPGSTLRRYKQRFPFLAGEFLGVGNADKLRRHVKPERHRGYADRNRSRERSSPRLVHPYEPLCHPASISSASPTPV